MRFILLDEILELEPGRSVKALKTMDPSEELFRDHFPGFPVVPGVLLVEMMGQAAGRCLFAENPQRGLPVLAKISSSAFRGWVKPGEAATIWADIRSSRASFATADCRIDVATQIVAEASLFFGFVPSDQLAPDYRDVILERFFQKQETCDPKTPQTHTSGSDREASSP